MSKIEDKNDLVDIKADEAPMTLFTPEPSVEKVFRDALAYLVFKWQLFAQLIYSDMSLGYTHQIPIAATDGKTIFLNPVGFIFAKITDVLEIVFVLAHEVLHRILYDIVLSLVLRNNGKVPLAGGGELPYDDDLMNMAMDYRINAILKDAGIGRMPECGLYDEKLSKAGMESCIEIYEKLWRAGKGKGKKPDDRGVTIIVGGHGHGKKGEGFDIHLTPTKKQIKADKGTREQAIVAAAQLHERTNPGSMPAALKRVLEEILNPVVPWEQHLRAIMTRKAGLPKFDWRFQNRRLISREDPMYYAKRAHMGCGVIALGGDNSGSITPRMVSRFGAEMTAIVRDLNPLQLVVIWCDVKVTRVDVIEDIQGMEEIFSDWMKTGVGGGGGTRFEPVFEEIEKRGIVPDMCVYFTDMYGSFPASAPDYPVIWACTSGIQKSPFGDIVHVEV